MSRDTAPLPFSRLPELLERLYDSLASFLDAKLALFRKEVWEEGQSVLRRGIGVAAAGVVALVGFMVLTAALISTLATRWRLLRHGRGNGGGVGEEGNWAAFAQNAN